MGNTQKDGDYLGRAEETIQIFLGRFIKKPIKTMLVFLGIILFFALAAIFNNYFGGFGTALYEKSWDPKPVDTSRSQPDKAMQSEKQVTDNVDTFFIKSDNYSGPKLKLLLAEPFDSTPFNGVYQAKLSLVMGVAAGEAEPVLKGITAPSGFDCLYDGIRRQPAVVVTGDLIGTVAYTYRINCVSKTPMVINDFKGFKFNYTY